MTIEQKIALGLSMSTLVGMLTGIAQMPIWVLIISVIYISIVIKVMAVWIG